MQILQHSVHSQERISLHFVTYVPKPRGVTSRFSRHISTPSRTWLTSVEAAVIHLLCGVPEIRDELLEFEHQNIYKSWWATIKAWFIGKLDGLEVLEVVECCGH